MTSELYSMTKYRIQLQVPPIGVEFKWFFWLPKSNKNESINKLSIVIRTYNSILITVKKDHFKSQ